MNQAHRLRVGSFNIKVGVDSSLRRIASDLYSLHLDLCAYQEIARDWSLGTSIDQVSYLATCQAHSKAVFFPLLKRDWCLDPYRGGPFHFDDFSFPSAQKFISPVDKQPNKLEDLGLHTNGDGKAHHIESAGVGAAGYYGIGLSANGSLTEKQFLLLSKEVDEQRGAFVAKWLPKANSKIRPLLVVNVHLSTDHKEREVQAYQLSMFLKQEKGPILLLGDLNDEPHSKTLQILCSEGGLENLSPPQLLEQFTFSVKKPHQRLDYILGKGVSCLNYMIDTTIQSSDHFPIWADITW